MGNQLTDIQKLLLERLDYSPQYLKQLVDKDASGVNFKRDVYHDIDQRLNRFYRHPAKNQWLVFGGIKRGW